MGTVLALFLVLSTLTGCASDTLTNLKNAPPILAAAPAVFTYQAESVRCDGTLSGSDGEALVEYAYEVPLLWVFQADGEPLETAATPGEVRALAAAEAFNEQFASWRDPELSELTEAAEQDRAFREEEGLSFLPYWDELACTVYQTERMISVSGTYSTYTGGAHGNTMLLSWNFDLDSGTFFDAATLDDDGFHAAVVQALKRQARDRALEIGLSPTEFFWGDYEEILENWTSYAVSFDETGMTVAFSPYELAAYAAGPQIFRLSYEELLPHLGPHGRALLGLEGEEGESSGN